MNQDSYLKNSPYLYEDRFSSVSQNLYRFFRSINHSNHLDRNFRHFLYQNTESISDSPSALWQFNKNVWTMEIHTEQQKEERNLYSEDWSHVRRDRGKDFLIIATQRQMNHSIQQRKEELTDGGQRNNDREDILEILERKLQQQNNQIEELKKMYVELSERIEEDKNRPLQQQRYAALFNNDLKLERMRYGIS